MKERVQKYMQKNTAKLFFIIFGVFVVSAVPAIAQVNTSVSGIELSDRSPVDVILYLLSWFLGILALIAVLIILYGGFVWMTSGGNEEKVAKAKQILKNGLIGFALIMSAWGIVLWLIGIFSAATGTGTTGSGPTTGYSTPGSTAGDFYVRTTEPSDLDTDVSLCTAVQATWSLNIDTDSVTTDSFTLEVDGGDPAGASCSTNSSCASSLCSSSVCVGDVVAGTIDFGPGDSTASAVFTPDVSFEAGTTYLGTLVGDGDNEILSEDTTDDSIDDSLTMGTDYTFTFTTGSTTDTTPPTIEENSSSPFPADEEINVCTNTTINFDFSEAMLVSSFNDDTAFVLDSAGTPDTPVAPDWTDLIALKNWSFGGDYDYASVRPNTQLDDYSLYSVRLYGGDDDGDGSFENGPTDMCGNPLDGNANGVAEGSTVDNYYGYDVDTESEDPITWETGENSECTPVIESISQTGYFYGESADAADVTIEGLYLAPHPEVAFEGSVIYASETDNTCFDEDFLGNVYTNTGVGQECLLEEEQTSTEILTKIPVGSGDSNVTVTVAGETSEPADESVDVQSPHITGLSPSDAAPGQYVTISGEQFETTTGTVTLRSEDGSLESAVELPDACGDVWEADEILVIVPQEYTNIETGETGNWESGDEAYFQIETASGKYSDLEYFTISDTVRPNLCTVSPSCGETGGVTFTATGDNFGAVQGDSEFVLSSDTDETAFYSTIGSWASQEINGTTDSALVQDAYWASVYDGETGLSSNARSYDVPCSSAPSVVEISNCDPDASVYPHPNPTPNQGDACINAMIGVIFDQTMDRSTFTTSNIYLEQYNEGDTLDETYGPLTVTGTIYNPSYTYTYQTETYDGFQYIPVTVPIDADQDGVPESTESYLQGNTWYKLIVSTNVTNDSGVGLAESYTMTFQTDDTDELCEVSTVDVTPASSTQNQYWNTDLGDVERETYSGTPYAGCNMLNSSTYSWDWAIDDTNIGNFGVGPGSTSSQDVYVSGNDEENEGTAVLNGAVEAVDDDANFVVDLGFCESDSDCASCSGSVCNESTSRCTPVIDSIDPENGQQGTWVTIDGCYFGSAKGTAYFNSTDDTVVAETDWPEAARCGDTWTNDQIILEVPEEYDSDDDGIDDSTFSDGEYNIEIETQYGDTDESTDIFTVNDTERPGICTLLPWSNGAEGDTIGAIGQSLGSDEGYASYLGTSDYLNPLGETDRISGDNIVWDPETVTSDVPSGANTGLAAEDEDGFRAIINGGDEQCENSDFCSNALDFTVSCESSYDCGSGCCSDSGVCQPAEFCSSGCTTDSDCEAAGACSGSTCEEGSCTPVINSLSPSIGPNEGPVTIQGCYFGSYSPSNGSAVTFDEFTADLLCSPGWSSNEIIVKVPDSGTMSSINPEITVTNQLGLSSNSESFAVSSQCSNGEAIPAGGVPILCDLFPGTGAAASADGSISGDTINFEGTEERYVDGVTEDFFYNEVSGDNFSYIDTDNTSAEVANGSGTGDATVQVEACSSNGLDFGLECENTDEDCPSGTFCTEGICVAESCGGCSIANNDTADSICGETSGGCYYDTGEADYCCQSRPTIESYPVEEAETDVCPNSAFEFEFSENVVGTTASIRIQKSDGAGGWTNVGKSIVYDPVEFNLRLTPTTPLDVSENYRFKITSSDDSTAGHARSAATGLHLQEGSHEREFTTAANTCIPDSIELSEKDSGEDTNYIFTEPNGTADFQATVYSSDGQELAQTDDIGWEYVWSPYESESCDAVAWIDADQSEEADTYEQPVVSGTEHGEDTSLEVEITGTGEWTDSLDDDIMLTTYFCEEDAIWQYNDSSSDDDYNGHDYPQNFRLIYCAEEDTTPELDNIVISEGTATDDWFLQYLFLNSQNENEAFSVRVFENTAQLNPTQWYQENAPNPANPRETTVDGYAAINDGRTWYIAASNIMYDSDGDGTNDTSPAALYNNMYVFTFNDEENMDSIMEDVMSYVRFNTNVNYAACEGSDKQKLIRDTKRVTDLGQIAALANEYYDANGEYPEPQSESFGSYISELTTSGWNSWQGALGNLFGSTLPEDPYNFFYAADDDEPWDASSTPWIAPEGSTAEADGKECLYDADNDLYYDENGTCWDPINAKFYSPENSKVYAYRRDTADNAYLYANLEYQSTDTEDYVDDYGVSIEPCAGISNAECDSFNYGITSENAPGDDWQAIP